MASVPKNCTKIKALSDASTSNSSISKPSGSESSSIHGAADRICKPLSHASPFYGLSVFLFPPDGV